MLAHPVSLSGHRFRRRVRVALLAPAPFLPGTDSGDQQRQRFQHSSGGRAHRADEARIQHQVLHGTIVLRYYWCRWPRTRPDVPNVSAATGQLLAYSQGARVPPAPAGSGAAPHESAGCDASAAGASGLLAIARSATASCASVASPAATGACARDACPPAPARPAPSGPS